MTLTRAKNKGNRRRFNFASNICRGWSSVGKQGRYADPSERCHNVWQMQRVRFEELDEEDGFFEECTWRYPVELKLQQGLSPWFRVVFVRWGPKRQFGHSKRPRVHSAGLSIRRLLWVGPDSNRAIQEDFDKTFNS